VSSLSSALNLIAGITTNYIVKNKYGKTSKSQFAAYNASDARVFSYANCEAYIILPFSTVSDSGVALSNTHIRLPGLNLASITQHRDKFMVTRFGSSTPVGESYGNRTTAGSFGFEIINQNPFSDAIAQYATYIGYTGNMAIGGRLNVDDLPPFDVLINFVDEFGGIDTIQIIGVTVLDQAHTVSVEQTNLTSMYSWIAQDATSITNIEKQVVGVQPTVSTPSYGNNNTLFPATLPTSLTI